MAQEEIDVEIKFEESNLYREIPAATSFEELETPQVNPDVIPEAKLPPPSDTAPQPAKVEPKAVVKPQPAVRKNVTISPAPGAIQPKPKRKTSLAPAKPAVTPIPQDKPELSSPVTPQINPQEQPQAQSPDAAQASTVIVEEIPVTGIELSTGEDVVQVPPNSNRNELDRR